MFKKPYLIAEIGLIYALKKFLEIYLLTINLVCLTSVKIYT